MIKLKKNTYECFNIGPENDSNKNVISLVKEYKKINNKFNYKLIASKKQKEAQFLYLDNSKVKKYLDWKPEMNFEKSLSYTFNWYENFIKKIKFFSENLLDEYIQKIKL